MPTFRSTAVASAVAMATVGSIFAYQGMARAAESASYDRVPTQIATSYSSSVQKLQSRLDALGYRPGPVDGLMGARTRDAIQRYQADNDLTVTGQSSTSLLDHLGATLQVRRQDENRPQTSETGEQRYSQDLIVQVETELRRRGYPISVVDGRLDAETEVTIRAYQRDNDLVATGKPSDQLLAHLRRDNVAPRADNYRQMVMDTQRGLNVRGYDAGPADGVMGPNTRDAIRTYQADADLPSTGRVDADLVTRLSADTSTKKPPETVETPAPNGARIATDDVSRRLDIRTVLFDDFGDGNYTNNPRWTVRAGSFSVTGGNEKALWTRVDRTVASVAEDEGYQSDNVAGDILFRVLEAYQGGNGSDAPALSRAEIGTQARIESVFRMRVRMSVHADGGTFAFGPYRGNDEDSGYRVIYSDTDSGPSIALAHVSSSDTRILARSDNVRSLNDSYVHVLELRRLPDGAMTLQVDGTRALQTADTNDDEQPFNGMSVTNLGGHYAVYGVRVEDRSR